MARYYRGNTKIEASSCSFIAGIAGFRCLSVTYRCSPPTTQGYSTATFPAAIDDWCYHPPAALLARSSLRPRQQSPRRHRLSNKHALMLVLLPLHSFAAYEWLVSPAGGGVAPAKVVVGGCSAGGGLVHTQSRALNHRRLLATCSRNLCACAPI